LMSSADASSIAGIVLPIKRAEELLASLPGVVSARIVAGASGAVDEIHLLTTDEVQPKATVRNVESALLAHLGMRVSHKKISVATTNEPGMRRSGEFASVAAATPLSAPAVTPVSSASVEEGRKRRLYFEDVEVRRRVEQRLMFALAVNLDEVRGQVLQGTSRRQLAVDERAAAALRGNLSPDNDFGEFVAAAFENRFDGGCGLIRSDEVPGRAAAKQQADRFNQNRLAGAGFAGQDVEAGAEFDLDRVDDREVGDA